MTEDGKKLKMLRKKRNAEPWCLLEGKREGGRSEVQCGDGLPRMGAWAVPG